VNKKKESSLTIVLFILHVTYCGMILAVDVKIADSGSDRVLKMPWTLEI
jgi:hypothetical protein